MEEPGGEQDQRVRHHRQRAAHDQAHDGRHVRRREPHGAERARQARARDPEQPAPLVRDRVAPQREADGHERERAVRGGVRPGRAEGSVSRNQESVGGQADRRGNARGDRVDLPSAS